MFYYLNKEFMNSTYYIFDLILYYIYNHLFYSNFAIHIFYIKYFFLGIFIFIWLGFFNILLHQKHLLLLFISIEITYLGINLLLLGISVIYLSLYNLFIVIILLTLIALETVYGLTLFITYAQYNKDINFYPLYGLSLKKKWLTKTTNNLRKIKC